MTDARAPYSFHFVFDHHVNAAALRMLRALNVNVVGLAEVGLAAASDVVVLRWAQREGRIVVTRNARDFVPLTRALAARGETFPGVLLLSSAIRQNDPAAHVRALQDWLARAAAPGSHPIESGVEWLR